MFENFWSPLSNWASKSCDPKIINKKKNGNDLNLFKLYCNRYYHGFSIQIFFSEVFYVPAIDEFYKFFNGSKNKKKEKKKSR